MAKANGSAPVRAEPMNVTHEIKDGVLYIGIDLAKRIGPSKSGKTTLVATTKGSVKLDGTHEGVSYSVNVFEGKKKVAA